MNENQTIIVLLSIYIVVFLSLSYFGHKYIVALEKSREFYRDQYMKIYQDIKDSSKVVDKIGFLNRRFDDRAKDVDEYLESTT